MLYATVTAVNMPGKGGLMIKHCREAYVGYALGGRLLVLTRYAWRLLTALASFPGHQAGALPGLPWLIDDTTPLHDS